MIALILREARAVRFQFIVSTTLFPIAYAIFGLTAQEFFGSARDAAPSVILSTWMIVLSTIFSEKIFGREWSDRRRRQLALLPVSPHRIVAGKFVMLTLSVAVMIAVTALARLGIHQFAPSRFLRCSWPETMQLLRYVAFAASLAAFAGTAFAGRIGAMGGAALVTIATAVIGLVVYRE